MEPDRFEEVMLNGGVVLDVRNTAAYAGYHIPGSLNIGFSDSIANWIGMVIDPESPLLLVVDTQDDYHRMRTELHRIGYDNIYGYLHGGISSWVYSGRPVDRLSIDSAQDLHNDIENGKSMSLIDVRTPGETSSGTIPGAITIPLADILSGKFDLSEDQHHILYCASGYRSNIAASFLQHQGYWDVRALAGGFIAWNRAGYSKKV
jgi:rhodanese-related sulfurtransferase